MYKSAASHNRMQAAQSFFMQDDKEHTVLIFFDSAREGNRAPIRKAFEDVEKSLGSAHAGKQSTSREFFLHTAPRPGSKHVGTGTALDVEMMFVKTRQPLSQIKKKARIHHEGNTGSTLYANVKRQAWKQLPQVQAVTKQAIFGESAKIFTGTLDPALWSTAAMKSKNSIPKPARGLLPLNWWERHTDFHAEVLDNFNIGSVIDLFGSVHLAIACLNAEPPKPYFGLCRNEAHASAMAEALDKYIVREIGREGPPPSKFYVEDLKAAVKDIFADDVGEDEEESECEAKEDNSEEE